MEKLLGANVVSYLNVDSAVSGKSLTEIPVIV